MQISRLSPIESTETTADSVLSALELLPGPAAQGSAGEDNRRGDSICLYP